MQVGVLEPRAVAQLLRLEAPAADGPAIGPVRVSSSKRWPSSVSGAMPPIVVKESRPLSSMFVIAIPISSMWPTIASVGAPSAGAHARERRAERVGRDLGERRGRLAPDSRRRRPRARTGPER